MNKLNSGFTHLSDKELDNKAAQIIAAIVGNAAFPSPAPTIVVLQGKLTSYQAALALPDGVVRTAQVKATRDDLSTAFEQLAGNLELTPNVTDAQLATTGFDLRKAPALSGEAPPIPANLRLKTTGVNMNCKARSILIPGTGRRKARSSSTRRVVVPGFEHGKDIWGRVRAIGPNNTASGWSDPATVMVA